MIDWLSKLFVHFLILFLVVCGPVIVGSIVAIPLMWVLAMSGI